MGQESVNIIIGGDFAPINESERTAVEFPERIWGDAVEIFRNTDFSIINLEVPLTDSFDKIDKTGPNIKADRENINYMKAANVSLVTLANNHIFDYGNKGVEDTLNVCRENGIDTVGAGKNLKEAQKTYHKQIKERRIAVVNFAENEWNSAAEDHAGSNPMDIIENIKQIREAKKHADFVIVIIHGGHEYFSYPSPRMQKQYRFYAQEGADVVVGHHTHCVSGYELCNGVPIFYSLGNLYFPWKNKSSDWHEGMLLKLEISANKDDIKFELIPYFQNLGNTSIILMKNGDRNKFFKKIEEINKVIADDLLLMQKWQEFVGSKKKEYLQYVIIPFDFVRRVVNKISILRFFCTKKQKLLIHNLINCESHRELMQESLNDLKNKN